MKNISVTANVNSFDFLQSTKVYIAWNQSISVHRHNLTISDILIDLTAQNVTGRDQERIISLMVNCYTVNGSYTNRYTTNIFQAD